MKKIYSIAALLSMLGWSTATSMAAQFSFLDPAYTQSIYTMPISGLGLTFAAGQLVTRDDYFSSGTTLNVYSLTANATIHGPSVHNFTANPVAGLSGGRGLTTGLDGFIYANTPTGITKINPTTFTIVTTYASSAAHAGPYGIGTLPDGRIAHVSSGNGVYLLDPVAGTDTLLYTSPSFIDGLAVDPSTGTIFLADLGSAHVRVLSSTGVLLDDVAVSHSPDGMAFGNGNAYANNTDGTITKLSFAGPGFTGAVTQTLFASGGTYGDFATVGPDGAFYVTQWGPQSGIHWDDGTTTTGDIVVVRIAALNGGGGFTPPPGVGGNGVPDTSPTALAALVLIGLCAVRYFADKKRQRAV
jgi:hypothetical protein